MKKILIISVILATTIASLAANKGFTKRDKNHDSMLSEAEFLVSKKEHTPEYIKKRLKAFKRIDSNADGLISEDEWVVRKKKNKKKTD